MDKATGMLFLEKLSELKTLEEKDAVKKIMEMLRRVAPVCRFGTGKIQPGYTARWPKYGNGKIIDLAYFPEAFGFKVWFHIENLQGKDGKYEDVAERFCSGLQLIYPNLKDDWEKRKKPMVNPTLTPIECVEKINEIEKMLQGL